MNDFQSVLNADIALKNKLYVSGWELSRTLQRIRSGNKEAIVDIFYQDEKAVAVFVMEKAAKDKTCCIQIFVKKDYRRKGIGSKLIERNKIQNVIFCLGHGLNNIDSFRAKNHLVFDYGMSLA